MGKQAPLGGVPRSMDLPPGNWTLEIEDLREDMTKGSDTVAQKFCVIAKLKSIAPVAGLYHTERMVIGTDDDPTADDPQTWQQPPGMYAAQRLANMMDAAKVKSASKQSVDLDAVYAEARGHRFDCVCVHKVDPGTRDPSRKGQINVNLQRFFPEGSLPKGTGAAQRPAPASAPAPRPAAAPAARPAPAPAPRRAAPPPPPVQEEVDEAEGYDDPAVTAAAGNGAADEGDYVEEGEVTAAPPQAPKSARRPPAR